MYEMLEVVSNLITRVYTDCMASHLHTTGRNVFIMHFKNLSCDANVPQQEWSWTSLNMKTFGNIRMVRSFITDKIYFYLALDIDSNHALCVII